MSCRICIYVICISAYNNARHAKINYLFNKIAEDIKEQTKYLDLKYNFL